jgi:hypothetical protein
LSPCSCVFFFHFGSRSMRCVVMVALRKQLICAAMFSTPLSDGKSLPTRAKMISLTMLQHFLVLGNWYLVSSWEIAASHAFESHIIACACETDVWCFQPRSLRLLLCRSRQVTNVSVSKMETAHVDQLAAIRVVKISCSIHVARPSTYMQHTLTKAITTSYLPLSCLTWP